MDDAGWVPDGVLESLVAAADRQMYQAKATGKNRVAFDEGMSRVGAV